MLVMTTVGPGLYRPLKDSAGLALHGPSGHSGGHRGRNCSWLSGGTGYHNSVGRDMAGGHLPSAGVAS